jgi:hypothetical protein
MSERMEQLLEQIIVQLDRLAREQKTIRELTSKFVNAMVDAEREIPEFMRRFANYMHDLHDIKYMYEEHGQHPPPHLFRELERCDDRYRQLIIALHAGGGTFEKIRREMAADPENRWDHTRFLPKQEETTHEQTGKSE